MNDRSVEAHHKNVSVNEGRSRVWLLAAIIVLVVAGGMWWLIWSGAVVLSVKTASQRVIVRTVLCNDDTISRYNSATGAETQEAYKNDVGAVVKDIERMKDYSKDPNCAFMAAEYYLNTNDTTRAQQNLDAVKAAADRGVYASGAIDSLESINHLEDRIKARVDNPETDGVGDRG